MLKDEEIYNIFDTERILNRPIILAVNEYSGKDAKKYTHKQLI